MHFPPQQILHRRFADQFGERAANAERDMPTAAASEASGREIRYVQVPMDDYVVALEQAQLPPDFVALIKYLFTEVLDGRNAYLTDGVQRALGRAPRDFADYARRAAASGAWKSTS